jgi:hypothetical protein
MVRTISMPTRRATVNRDRAGDAIILVACVVIAIFSAVWGLDQSPREYGLLLVVTVIGAVLMARKLVRGGTK